MKTFGMVEDYALFDEDHQVQQVAAYNGGAGDEHSATNDAAQYTARVKELFDRPDGASRADVSENTITANWIKNNPASVLKLALDLIGKRKKDYGLGAKDADGCGDHSEHRCGYLRVDVQARPGHPDAQLQKELAAAEPAARDPQARAESHFSFSYASGVMKQNIVTFVRSERRDLFRKEVADGLPDRGAAWSNIAGLIPDLERSTEEVRLRARKLHVHMWGSLERFVGRPSALGQGGQNGRTSGFGLLGKVVHAVGDRADQYVEERDALEHEIQHLPFYLAQGRSPLRPPGELMTQRTNKEAFPLPNRTRLEKRGDRHVDVPVVDYDVTKTWVDTAAVEVYDGMWRVNKDVKHFTNANLLAFGHVIAVTPTIERLLDLNDAKVQAVFEVLQNACHGHYSDKLDGDDRTKRNRFCDGTDDARLRRVAKETLAVAAGAEFFREVQSADEKKSAAARGAAEASLTGETGEFMIRAGAAGIAAGLTPDQEAAKKAVKDARRAAVAAQEDVARLVYFAQRQADAIVRELVDGAVKRDLLPRSVGALSALLAQQHADGGVDQSISGSKAYLRGGRVALRATSAAAGRFFAMRSALAQQAGVANSVHDEDLRSKSDLSDLSTEQAKNTILKQGKDLLSALHNPPRNELMPISAMYSYTRWGTPEDITEKEREYYFTLNDRDDREAFASMTGKAMENFIWTQDSVERRRSCLNRKRSELAQSFDCGEASREQMGFVANFFTGHSTPAIHKVETGYRARRAMLEERKADIRHKKALFANAAELSYCRALTRHVRARRDEPGTEPVYEGPCASIDGDFNEQMRRLQHDDGTSIRLQLQPVLESPMEVTHALIDLLNIVFAQDKRATRPPARDAVDKAVAQATGELKTKNLLQRFKEQSDKRSKQIIGGVAVAAVGALMMPAVPVLIAGAGAPALGMAAGMAGSTAGTMAASGGAAALVWSVLGKKEQDAVNIAFKPQELAQNQQVLEQLQALNAQASFLNHAFAQDSDLLQNVQNEVPKLCYRGASLDTKSASKLPPTLLEGHASIKFSIEMSSCIISTLSGKMEMPTKELFC